MRNIQHLIILIAFLLSACSQETCDQETDVFMEVAFYSSGTGSQQSISDLTVYGLYMPGSLIYDHINSNSISLPLNPGANSCSFIIDISDVTDTLEIRYKSNLEFISKACGYIYVYEIEEILFTKNSVINSIIVNKSVTPGDEENIRTFF